MEQGQKKPRMVKVKRMFEPDRIASINLQTAYEQVVPARQYRLLRLELPEEKLEVTQEQKEEEAV
jgi:hypothetical protein